ncbi:hypothetical protein NDU88_002848 [Pleurodeles waltl]|uniref:Uncharacterized protein n=1 Tax=Pleurodeles waltl TaxID=8319 RepID=A0AAV7W0U2_PLEWA|nr:hypothetical protein NDU88_002848 [Pleurodeles waltl]
MATWGQSPAKPLYLRVPKKRVFHIHTPKVKSRRRVKRTEGCQRFVCGDHGFASKKKRDMILLKNIMEFTEAIVMILV